MPNIPESKSLEAVFATAVATVEARSRRTISGTRKAARAKVDSSIPPYIETALDTFGEDHTGLAVGIPGGSRAVVVPGR